ncbi:MAG: hypothetical protein AAGA75_22170 [Cyanobacteria bacterium P01_E01_bin.6]
MLGFWYPLQSNHEPQNAQALEKTYTIDEYLALELVSETHSEYRNGNLTWRNAIQSRFPGLNRYPAIAPDLLVRDLSIG